MNINLSVKCFTCDEITDCRVGLSNRDTQPLRFHCKTCSSPIDLIADQDGKIDLHGAEHLKDEQGFKENHHFVDLHIDFPVSFGRYVMGDTPFLKAVERIGHGPYEFHNARLSALNELYHLVPDLNRIIRLYYKNHNLFATLCQSRFGESVLSDKQEDINAALYNVLAKAFYPFSMPDDNADIVNEYLDTFKKIIELDKPAMDLFVSEIFETEFLKNIQRDCLEIYPRILEQELLFRPALYLDFDENYNSEITSFRISTNEFSAVKDLYKDISEVISRGLILVGGINNLIHRQDHNNFKSIGKGTPKSLDAFAEISLGSKCNYLDDSWYELKEDSLNNQLRNSIAHFKAEYDEITQIIHYYPKREGMRQEKLESMYFLDFIRRLLISYREMHRMNQLIKCLYYYYLFMYKKN